MESARSVRVVLAPDSFKESMSAVEAAAAMVRGVRAAAPRTECTAVPMSDGGEGFAAAVGTALGADPLEATVSGARGRPVHATLWRAGDLAVLDVASAIGLALVPPADRNVMASDSRGVGELLLAALDAGTRRLVVGLGGSATVDGGAGMLVALGARLLDADGRTVPPTPEGLTHLDRVDLAGLDRRLADVRVQVACDVTNPLLGPAGASAVYGPQKGATPAQVAQLERVLNRVVDGSAPAARRLAQAPGAGAAGGLGWALMAFLGAAHRPGVELLAETTGLAAAVAEADLVLTGEGAVDAQTLSGKTVAGVARIAADAGVPCVVLAGRVGSDADPLLAHGVTALVPILPETMDLPTALRQGPVNLERAAATVLRVFLAGASRQRAATLD